MPSKICRDCGMLGPKESYKRNRCPTCAASWEQQRGTRQERGAGGQEYDAFARWIKAHELACACRGECGSHWGGDDWPCGQHYGDPENPITVGHIWPRSQGGGNDWGNLRPECRKCNLRKKDRR